MPSDLDAPVLAMIMATDYDLAFNVPAWSLVCELYFNNVDCLPD